MVELCLPNLQGSSSSTYDWRAEGGKRVVLLVKYLHFPKSVLGKSESLIRLANTQP